MGHGTRMVNLLIGVPIESFLALALLTSTRPAAPMYSVSGTHAGAAILWVGAELFTFIALVPVFVQWLRSEQRREARLDAQLDAREAAAREQPDPVPVTEVDGRPPGPPVGWAQGRGRLRPEGSRSGRRSEDVGEGGDGRRGQEGALALDGHPDQRPRMIRPARSSCPGRGRRGRLPGGSTALTRGTGEVELVICTQQLPEVATPTVNWPAATV